MKQERWGQVLPVPDDVMTDPDKMHALLDQLRMMWWASATEAGYIVADDVILSTRVMEVAEGLQWWPVMDEDTGEEVMVEGPRWAVKCEGPVFKPDGTE